MEEEKKTLKDFILILATLANLYETEGDQGRAKSFNAAAKSLESFASRIARSMRTLRELVNPHLNSGEVGDPCMPKTGRVGAGICLRTNCCDDWITRHHLSKAGRLFALVIVSKLVFTHSLDEERGDVKLPRHVEPWNKSQAKSCSWINGTWDEPERQLSYLEQRMPVIFAGKHLLTLGGSTSRDQAGDFFQMVLSSELRGVVARNWLMDSVQGYQLLPKAGKNASEFYARHDFRVVNPLLEAGWKIKPVSEKDAGCGECHSSFTNLDYIASLTQSKITYEFSWKPEIFSFPSDLLIKYCEKHYDIVIVEKGLHDAYFYDNSSLSNLSIERRVRSLARSLECFPKSTLVVVRLPYAASRNKFEEPRLVAIREVLLRLAKQGIFGVERTLIVDGNMISSTKFHPKTFDGHHYDSRVARAVLRLIAFGTLAFDSRTKLSFSERIFTMHGCGIEGV